MGLREYHRKRDFNVTPEPKGREARREGRAFVVQKHAASHLHYDFRLELEGVLKSWAVPKGPCLDPSEKRLAMQTEDHPVDYGDFEGIIPEGEYGGGTVVVWDRGHWEPVEDNPHQALRAGRLKFRLHGEKLRGTWNLVKLAGQRKSDERSWLLIKDRDQEARALAEYDLAKARPESVLTGRSLEEIAADADRVWHSNRAHEARPAAKGRLKAARPVAARRSAPVKHVDGAAIAAAVPKVRKGPLPRALKPQLATLVSAPPPGDDWLHEMKFDGYRILARVEGGRVRLLSRNGRDWTAQFPEVAEAVAGLRLDSALLDGEVAVTLPNGTTSFQALQNYAGAPAGGGRGHGALHYFVFDLLHLEGHDLTHAALEERKAALRKLLAAALRGGALRYSDHLAGSGEDFFRNACRLSLEGIVCKRRSAPYEQGRTRSWLKVKCLQGQEFVIGGYTDPEGSRTGLGSLLLGVHDEKGALVYVGRVGTGFTEKSLRDLRRRLSKLERRSSPFHNKVTGRAAGRAHWAEPRLVAEVEFTEWTGDGRLRHPTFRGLREDKPAGAIVRERAQPLMEAAAGPEKERPRRAAPRPRKSRRSTSPPAGEAAVAGVRLSHPDRVLFAEQGVTKRALAEFYESIADWILPQVAGRPLTLVRCPEGASQECFFMKHSGVWAPPALRRVKIREKTKTGEYLVVEDLAGLVSLVQMGILEIHTWNSQADRVEEPDRIVFDLDPGPRVAWPRVVAAARLLRERLLALGATPFLKTTGGAGLHLVVPLKPGHGWDDSFEFSRLVSEALVRERPREFTTSMPKASRQDKILIDFMRNNRGNTSIAAYSTRARPGAPLSVPLAWEELSPRRRSDHYTIANLGRRLAGLRRDPWADYEKKRVKLAGARRKLPGPDYS